VVNEEADVVSIITGAMSRPLKVEVDPRVAEAAHLAHVMPTTD
jgi:hypothetical protein